MYSLLGETEIKQQINAFVQNNKQGISNKPNNRKPRQDWLNILEELVQDNKLGSPEEIYNDFIEIIELGGVQSLKDEVPQKDVVKRKISPLKTKFKNIAHHAIL